MRKRRPNAQAVELTDDERKLVINLITVEIETSKSPLSPRIESLKRIRAKLHGEKPAAPVGEVSKRKSHR